MKASAPQTISKCSIMFLNKLQSSSYYISIRLASLLSLQLRNAIKVEALFSFV